MKKKIGLVMLFMVLLMGMLGVVYASTHTGSAQWKNKNYKVSFTGSSSTFTAFGSIKTASSQIMNSKDIYRTGTASVTCYEYVTATKVPDNSKSAALNGEEGIVVIIDRVPDNSNYKYEHSATLRMYNFGLVVDSFTYTAWQNI